jgi:hypothetical protein
MPTVAASRDIVEKVAHPWGVAGSEIVRRGEGMRTALHEFPMSLARFLWAGLLLIPGCAAAHAVGHAIECTLGPDNDQHCGWRGVAERADRTYRTAFVKSEYVAYRNPGTASIQGQARSVRRDTLAGTSVILKPVTSLSREWWTRTIKHGEAGLSSPSPWQNYDHTAPVDSLGRFQFDSLAAGEYFLASRVTEPLGQKSWWIGAIVEVQAGAQVTADLGPIK